MLRFTRVVEDADQQVGIDRDRLGVRLRAVDHGGKLTRGARLASRTLAVRGARRGLNGVVHGCLEVPDLLSGPKGGKHHEDVGRRRHEDPRPSPGLRGLTVAGSRDSSCVNAETGVPGP